MGTNEIISLWLVNLISLKNQRLVNERSTIYGSLTGDLVILDVYSLLNVSLSLLYKIKKKNHRRNRTKEMKNKESPSKS